MLLVKQFLCKVVSVTVSIMPYQLTKAVKRI